MVAPLQVPRDPTEQTRPGICAEPVAAAGAVTLGTLLVDLVVMVGSLVVAAVAAVAVDLHITAVMVTIGLVGMVVVPVCTGKVRMV